MIVEAQAARTAWSSPPALRWRVGSPRIPPQWKQPPPTRSRMIGEARSKRHATHPLNALLSACFSVTAGRLAMSLAAHGAHPAIGYLHSDNRGRFSLAFDAIEPLRPNIEKAVFDFVRKHQFSANDFIRIKDAPGSIRLGSNLMRTVIADCRPVAQRNRQRGPRYDRACSRRERAPSAADRPRTASSDRRYAFAGSNRIDPKPY